MDDKKVLEKPEHVGAPDVVTAAPHIVWWMRAISRAISVGAIIIGSLEVLGGLLNIGLLKGLLTGGSTASPNAALAIVLIGIALWQLQDENPIKSRIRIAQFAAAAASLMGLVTIGEYIFDRDLGIDHFLSANSGAFVGAAILDRMAPGTAISLIILGAALLLQCRSAPHWSIQLLALAAGWTAFLACLGHLYGAELLYGVVCIGEDCEATSNIPRYASMALPTAIALGLLAYGILASRPNYGLMKIISSDSAGGLVARRILPAAIVFPTGFGWLNVSLLDTDFIQPDLGAALVAGIDIIAVGGVLWWSSWSLFKIDMQRRESERELALVREREIEIGFRIQRTLLFDYPPHDLPWARFAALTVPSDRIDGDFFDFLIHNDRQIDVVLGDVMGKGVPAALLGAATKTHLLRAFSHLIAISNDRDELPDPKDIITLANSHIANELIELESFVTVCYARFDLNRDRLIFVDCGHTHTIHFHQQTGTCTLLAGENLPLGADAQEIYTQFEAEIMPGDLFVFYSDGVTEARNREGEFFGVNRLIDLVQAHADLDPDELTKRLRAAVEIFSGSDTFADDLTCVTVKLKEHRLPGPLRHAELTLPSDLKELSVARDFVEHTAGRGVLSEEKVNALKRAVSEAASNIIIHAYGRRPDRRIELDAEVFADRVVVRLHHLGMSFDPKHVATPKFDGSQEGGFGMYIIAQSVDEVRYYMDDRGRNCIALVKWADQPDERRSHDGSDV